VVEQTGEVPAVHISPDPTDGRDAAGAAERPTPGPPVTEGMLIWSRSQRGVVLVMLAIIVVICGWRMWRNPTHVSNPQPDEPARASELRDKIDPNTADWETLAALPTLGGRRAKGIVSFREQMLAGTTRPTVFQRPEDLLKVHGIGAAMMNQISPYLEFPTTSPTFPAERD